MITTFEIQGWKFISYLILYAFPVPASKIFHKWIILCLQKVDGVTNYFKRPIEKPISLERSVETFLICFKALILNDGEQKNLRKDQVANNDINEWVRWWKVPSALFYV